MREQTTCGDILDELRSSTTMTLGGLLIHQLLLCLAVGADTANILGISYCVVVDLKLSLVSQSSITTSSCQTGH
jgi:hypothetical protein